MNQLITLKDLYYINIFDPNTSMVVVKGESRLWEGVINLIPLKLSELTIGRIFVNDGSLHVFVKDK